MNPDALSLREMADGIARAQWRSVDLLRHYYNKLKTANQQINAVTQFAPYEELLAQAQRADDAIRYGELTGPLHGVPVTVKDAFKLKGFVCAKGCTGLANFVADTDAEVVQRLRQAGALIMAQTNVPELLLSYETSNDVYGTTLNPHHLAHSPGGSSGGEAAAIAAGASPAGLASDAAGSVRIPAHFCGVAGLKVTQGRIPSTGAVPRDGAGISSRFASYGVMGRFVDDLNTLYEVVAGPDQRDPYTPPVPILDYRQTDIRNLRIGHFSAIGEIQAKPSIAKEIELAASRMKNIARSCQPCQFDEAQASYKLLFETLLLGGDQGQSWQEILGLLGVQQASQPLQRLLRYASECSFSHTEMRHRLAEIDRFCFQMLRRMDDFDVLICPVSANTACLSGQAMENVHEMIFCQVFSLTGWPSVVLPVGKDENGLPIGIQIVARPWCEDHALAVAAALERLQAPWQAASL